MELVDMVEISEQKLEVMQEGMRLATRIREFTKDMTIEIAKHIGEKSGWAEEENDTEMLDALKEALKEGDYVSVANYSMFLNGLGYKPGRSTK